MKKAIGTWLVRYLSGLNTLGQKLELVTPNMCDDIHIVTHGFFRMRD